MIEYHICVERSLNKITSVLNFSVKSTDLEKVERYVRHKFRGWKLITIICE